MLQHYIKTAFRHLLKYKTQNLISILGLSVGILCFSICLYCSRFIYSVDQCFTNKERIANVNLYTPDGDIYSGIPANLIESLRQTPVDEAEDYTFVGYPRPRSYNVETPEGKELPYEDLYQSIHTPNSARFMGNGFAYPKFRNTDPLTCAENIRQ